MPQKRPHTRLPRVQWITAEGCFDMTRFPIDPVLKQVLSEDGEAFRSGCRVLGAMADHGRTEVVVVYLLGLMCWYRDDLHRLSTVIEQLSGAARELEPEKVGLVADVLAGELRRVKSSNTTRGYLDTVIRGLALLPKDVALPRLEDLAADRSFSQKMRAKLGLAVESLLFR